MRKKLLDLLLFSISLAIFAVAWAYLGQVRYRIACLGASAAMAIVFLFLAWTEKETGQRAGTGLDTEGSKRVAITEVVLPINHQVFLFWEHHFGIIGVEETMVMDKVVLAGQTFCVI